MFFLLKIKMDTQNRASISNKLYYRHSRAVSDTVRVYQKTTNFICLRNVLVLDQTFSVTKQCCLYTPLWKYMELQHQYKFFSNKHYLYRLRGKWANWTPVLYSKGSHFNSAANPFFFFLIFNNILTLRNSKDSHFWAPATLHKVLLLGLLLTISPGHFLKQATQKQAWEKQVQQTWMNVITKLLQDFKQLHWDLS